MTTTNDAERAGFEANIKQIYPNTYCSLLRRTGEDYQEHYIVTRWEGWQAGAAWQCAQGAVPEGWQLVPITLTQRMYANCHLASSVTARVWRDLLAAAPAQPAERQEQHPDDAAVDRFAVAMKAKLAKSREKGRHGWQNASAAHLSSLLYHHVYKSDPLDVANLAMMLHQNGQAIELPLPI